ncbi:hypothetical protein D2Q93_02230 [Alicyclobacillaceae bacterium I2511]|nr:hypothetical protein D2Q93_02230 [Alicyclobacillaceae bacterium I2511]
MRTHRIQWMGRSASGRVPVWFMKIVALTITVLYSSGVFAWVEQPSVQAAQDIHISALIGFNGFYSSNQWVPVRVQVQNGGPARQVQLAIPLSDSLGNGRRVDGTLLWSVRLPAHGQTTTVLAVPGRLMDGNTSVECLYQGVIVTSLRLSGTALGKVALVAVLSHQAQAGQFLTGSTDGPGGNPVLPVSLIPGEMPASANLLTALTAIAATPDVLNELSHPQQQALINWVNLGGLLIVTGAQSGNSVWSNCFPLLSGPQSFITGQSLASFVSDSATPLGKITAAARGVDSAGVLWAGTAQHPLLAALMCGRGMVVQTAFSPVQSPLLTWSSNAALWTSVLQRGDAGGQSAFPATFSTGQALSLASASDSLSPLRLPSLRFWASVFLLYLLLIGPGLFFWLRRRHTEATAWIWLPVISLATTGGIYWFGISERPSGMLTEAVGVLDLVGNGTAESYGIRGFTSPKVSSAAVRAGQPAMLTVPLAESVPNLGTAQVTMDPTGTAYFYHLGRWAVRYVFTVGAVSGQGQLDAELWATLSGLHGYVRNDTPYPLQGLAVGWNKKLYLLGDLAPGQTASILPLTTLTTTSGDYLGAYGSYNHDITRGVGRTLGNYAAQQGLLQLSQQANTAILMATTDSVTPALGPVITRQKLSVDDTRVLVRQFASVALYPNVQGMFSP